MYYVTLNSTRSREKNLMSEVHKNSGHKKLMSSAPQDLAQKGKEARDAALASGALLMHPYKFPCFQPKKVKGVKKSPVVPGSAVEEEMIEECRKFIRWMLTSECLSLKNSGYVTKCDCRKNMREGDLVHGTRVMVNFLP